MSTGVADNPQPDPLDNLLAGKRPGPHPHPGRRWPVCLGFSGVADRIWRDEQRRLMFRAGAISVITWVAGLGFRFGFAYYAYHSGGPAVARFSVRHDITGADIWTTALSGWPSGRRWPARRPAGPPGPRGQRAGDLRQVPVITP